MTISVKDFNITQIKVYNRRGYGERYRKYIII